MKQIENIHFGTQCVPNRKQAIELTHRPKITDSKALSKPNSQLVQVVAAPAQEGHQLLQLRQIQLYHITVQRHFPQIGFPVDCPKLGHFLLDQSQLLRGLAFQPIPEGILFSGHLLIKGNNTAYVSQILLDKTFYCCTKYRKFGKDGCSSHNIEARTVHEVVLADIQKHAGQALTDRKAMVTEIAERLNLQMSADREQQKKELRQCKQRVSEIENLYAKLYEDLTRELITEKRFQMLSARFDSEQEELTAKIKELEKSAIADKEQLSSIVQFAEQISVYAGITKLNFKIINQLIEKFFLYNTGSKLFLTKFPVHRQFRVSFF